MSSSPRRRRSSRRRRPSGARACTRSAGSGWTAGKRAAAATPATTGASFGSAFPASSAASSSTRASFAATIPSPARSSATTLDGLTDAETIANNALWTEILPRSPLQGDAQNLFAVQAATPFTHLRLNIFPDGGVARLRVHGEGYFDPARHHPGSEVDLAAAENGGQVLLVSDMFFGNRHNLIMPGRSTHMGDGWETRRRRGPGHDWSIVKLATRGTLHRIEIDTDHYKGNAPGRCMVEASDARSVPNADIQALASRVGAWHQVLRETPLLPHTRHRFTDLTAQGPATHVRLNIYPDGGIARMRVYGMPERA